MNIKQFWKAVLAQDEEEIRKYFHKDAYVNWHCTNEHFTVDEYIIANCEYPGEWDGIIERTEMVNELIITVTQISPHYDSRRRTNYAQKTSLTNSSLKTKHYTKVFNRYFCVVFIYSYQHQLTLLYIRSLNHSRIPWRVALASLCSLLETGL